MIALPPCPLFNFSLRDIQLYSFAQHCVYCFRSYVLRPRSRKYNGPSFQESTFLWGRQTLRKSTKWKEGWKTGWRHSNGGYFGVPLEVLLGVVWQLPSKCSSSELWPPESFLVPMPCWSLPSHFRERRLSAGLHSATLNCPATARQLVI